MTDNINKTDSIIVFSLKKQVKLKNPLQGINKPTNEKNIYPVLILQI